MISAGQLAGFLNRIHDSRIAVIGDLMLDEYVIGSVERASPEAPVPLVNIEHESYAIGGAAHVANLISTLGAHVQLWGVIGRDATGDRLLEGLVKAGIDASHVERVQDRCTSRKVRVMARRQHLLRLDREEVRPLDAKSATQVMRQLHAAGPFDAMVLSDYAKGFLTPDVIKAAIDAARSWEIPIIVDPKSTDFRRYRGATIIKPNRTELEMAWGRKLGEDFERDVVEAGKSLRETAGAKVLIVTLGEYGLATISGDSDPVFHRATPREVYDAAGAGDTVAAVLAVALAAGADLDIAARLANEAAGIAVGRSGVSVISPGDLAAALAPQMQHKVLSRDELLDRVAWWRLQSRQIVFTNGCFDLLHIGHVSLLQEAARQGDALLVAINSDDSVKRLKGNGRPVMTASTRAAVLSALACVDAVAVFEEDTPLELIEQVRPDVLVKGGDYKPDQIVGRDLVESLGGRVVTIPLLPGHSTSLLLQHIQAVNSASRSAETDKESSSDLLERSQNVSGG